MSQEQITQETVPVAETTQPTTEAPKEQISSTTEQPTVAKSWKEAISEEFRNDPNISKFTEIDALAKSYINATRMIGQDKVAVPNENSTDDQWNEVYTKLGRPESADKYKLDINSEVAPIDEGAIKTFAETSHKLGLNNKQAQGILEYYKSIMEGSVQQSKIDTETAQAQAEQQLRQEWGKNFDENVKKAGSIAKANLGVDVLDMQLKDGTRLGDHPEVIKGFAKIADMMSEDKIVSTESENVDQGRDLEQEISRIMNDRSGPYWNKGHPEHDKIVQQVYTLRSMIDGK
ncbi:putative capsid assembly protein [Pelagibacter phage HTVC035P]|nr:putative capsid assembly protein [Pelagibacter phage HTVC035P]